MFLGCSKQVEQKEAESEIFGVYKNQQPNMIEKSRHSTGSYVAGSTLALSKDSTYIFKTCGMFMSGTWEQTGDSLFLNLKLYKFLNDSLNRIKHNPPPADFFAFKVKDNSVLAHMRQIGDSEKTSINKLVKE